MSSFRMVHRATADNQWERIRGRPAGLPEYVSRTAGRPNGKRITREVSGSVTALGGGTAGPSPGTRSPLVERRQDSLPRHRTSGKRRLRFGPLLTRLRPASPDSVGVTPRCGDRAAPEA